jgi:hypothetical protein
MSEKTKVECSGHVYCVDESDIETVASLLKEKNYYDAELEVLFEGKYSARATIALIGEARRRAFIHEARCRRAG